MSRIEWSAPENNFYRKREGRAFSFVEAAHLGLLKTRRLKCGVLRSIVDLQAGINGFLAEPTPNPKPFG